MSGEDDVRQEPYFPAFPNDKRVVIETETMYRELVESGAMTVKILFDTIMSITEDELNVQLKALNDEAELKKKIDSGEFESGEVVDFMKYVKKGKGDAQHKPGDD